MTQDNRYDNDVKQPDANRDPITGTPGAHPVGVGVGTAAGGAAAGAVAGAVAGPVGAVAGAVVGGIVGGLAGKGVAERINPTVEDTYWREAHTNEPYYNKDYGYDDYAPAYRTGYEGASRYAGEVSTFDDAEPRLRDDYTRNRGNSRLEWDTARPATQSAWERAIDGGESRDAGVVSNPPRTR